MRLRLAPLLVLALLALLSACRTEPPAATRPGAGQPAPEISLNDHNGAAFRLSDQRGKVVLLNFGYTNCPDVCPIALAELARVKQALGPQASRVQVVFVTVDPVRDKPARLKEFLGAFDPTFIGLTGPYQALSKVWDDYKVRVDPGGPDAPTPAPDQRDTQVYDFVGHSGITYLIDPRGAVRAMYPSQWPADQIVTDVQESLK